MPEVVGKLPVQAFGVCEMVDRRLAARYDRALKSQALAVLFVDPGTEHFLVLLRDLSGV